MDESVQEITKRSENLRNKRNRRISRSLYSIAGALAVALMGTVYRIIGPNRFGQDESAYGSSFLSEEAGGYVIIAILAFAFGVTLALAITHHQRKS